MAIMLHYFKGVIIYDINMNLATDGIYSNSKKKNYIRCPKTLLFANINIYKFNTAIIIYQKSWYDKHSLKKNPFQFIAMMWFWLNWFFLDCGRGGNEQSD